jgi:hypothetical protein
MKKIMILKDQNRRHNIDKLGDTVSSGLYNEGMDVIRINQHQDIDSALRSLKMHAKFRRV